MQKLKDIVEFKEDVAWICETFDDTLRDDGTNVVNYSAEYLRDYGIGWACLSVIKDAFYENGYRAHVATVYGGGVQVHFYPED